MIEIGELDVWSESEIGYWIRRIEYCAKIICYESQHVDESDNMPKKSMMRREFG